MLAVFFKSAFTSESDEADIHGFSWFPNLMQMFVKVTVNQDREPDLGP